jgi:hypothetical protein
MKITTIVATLCFVLGISFLANTQTSVDEWVKE